MRDEIIKKVIEEIEQRHFGVTKQLLDIHSVTYENGLPKIERLDLDKKDTAIAYVPFHKEDFYLAVYLDTKPEVKVRWTGTEPGNGVYFRATSKKLTLDEIKSMTTLKPTVSWNIGDMRPNKKSQYNFSAFEFEPNPERADEVEDKIEKLLDQLELDKEGVKRLAKRTNAHIQVHWYSHNGNGMLGGIHLDKETIKRVADLGLAIDFDLYTGGQPFKDH